MHDKSACSSRLGVKYSIPRPSLPLLVALLVAAVCKKNRGRRPGVSYHVIRSTHDVTGSRHIDIFLQFQRS